MNLILILIIVFILILNIKQKFGLIENLNQNLKGYTHFLNDQYKWNYTPGKIPKIIIKTGPFKRNNFPQIITDIFNKTLNVNPDYQLYYFDNDECGSFMKDYSVNIFNYYNQLIPGAYQADLFRVCILEKYGGCYCDLGFEMLETFDNILQEKNIVLVKDKPFSFNNCKGIYNAFMCSYKNNLFFKQIVKQICENIENKYYGQNSLDITGPSLVGKVFIKNENLNNFEDIKTGNHTLNNGDKLKMLKTYRNIIETIIDYFTKGSYTGKIKENDKDIINTKFKDYYKLMYSDKKKYTHYWKEKNVFKS